MPDRGRGIVDTGVHVRCVLYRGVAIPRGYGVSFISNMGGNAMNDNLASKPKTDWTITLFVFVIIAAMPGGIIWAWQIESGWPLMLSLIAFLLFVAGGAL